MNSLISSVRNFRHYINRFFRDTVRRTYPLEIPDFCLITNGCNGNLFLTSKKANSKSILDDVINSAFLWAVPKHRRSLERRMTRRMGFGKLLLPKKNLIVCEACGHFHPVHTVCGNCYNKVKLETELMQDAIMNELKLDPIDKEVVVVYQNEPKDSKYFQGKRIVELPKTRPPWFSRNLLAKDSEIPRKGITAVKTSQISSTIEDTNK